MSEREWERRRRMRSIAIALALGGAGDRVLRGDAGAAGRQRPEPAALERTRRTSDDERWRSRQSRAPSRRHRAVALWCAALVVAMVGAAYAAVPLYRLFCQVTGFDGTPRIATRALRRRCSTGPSRSASTPTWRRASPGASSRCSTTMQVKIGENALAFYRATNISDRPVRGMATFNVLPEQAAAFFNKLECFCFKEQLLQPGETPGDAGQLLRRSADRGRQGRARRDRTSRCPTRSIPSRRRSRASPRRPAAAARLRHRQQCRAAARQDRNEQRRSSCPRRRAAEGIREQDAWPTRTPSTTTTTW